MKILPESVETMEQLKESILVIDDDQALCELLAEYLTNDGFTIDLAHDGREGLEKALGGRYSLFILDVMLPGGQNGFTVLQNIRAKTDTPVLMLTARGEEVDRIIGLEMGADDYLPKPFNPRELLARIHAILRRIKSLRTEEVSGSAGKRYKIDDVELNYSARVVLRAGVSVEVTAVEFSILDKLMRNAGELVTRDELAREVLGRPLSPYDRSVDVHVSRLRKKLSSDDGKTERIKSIRGSGYIYVSSSILAGDGLPSPDIL
jgi:two-component system, OmpR family, response regulator CpxR